MIVQNPEAGRFLSDPDKLWLLCPFFTGDYTVNKSVALKLGVVQDGILNAEVAGVPVSTAFLEIAVGDMQLGKKHLGSASNPFFSCSGRSLGMG